MSPISPIPFAAMAMLLVLGGCARSNEAPAIAAKRTMAAEAIVAGPNAGLSSAGTIWHLRGALNVAALKCGGDAADRYNAALKTHAVAFSRAQARLKREYRRGGGDWQDRFDDRQTQLYNHAANPRGEKAFCTVAKPVLAEIGGVPPQAFPGFAKRSLASLDRTLTD